MIIKAKVAAGIAVDEPQALSDLNTADATWSEQNAITAPYDPSTLLALSRMVPHLRPNLDAYAVNIHGYGHQFAPVADWMAAVDSDDARDAIRQALEFELWTDAVENGDDTTDEVEVDEAAIDEWVARLERSMRRERFRAEGWFKNAVSDRSFSRLRRDVCLDKETIGWGCIEIIPDAQGRLQRLGYVPAHTVRPVADDGTLVEVAEPNALTPLSEGREVLVRRRFPRYVQIVADRRVYFKSPGDPRALSRLTGRVYKDAKEMQRKDNEGPNAVEAHELIWIAHHDPETPCSPPRWSSALLRVLGTREADETNFFHLHNKTMAGGILFVFGGKINQDVKDRLERSLVAELQGTENTSRILVVEAMPMKGAPGERSTLPQMQFQSLRDAHITDGMFAEYDTNCADAIGATFRLSPLLRGRTPSDLNRATAEAALRFAEKQVFEPERTDFDWIINRIIMPRIGVQFLKFVSNAPPVRSTEEVGEFVSKVAPYGGLLPYEIRNLASAAIGTNLDNVSEDWARWPMPMTLAGILPPGADGLAPEVAQSADAAARIKRLEDILAQTTTEDMRAAGLNYDTQPTPELAPEDDEENPDGV
jgi:capsid portal protein